MENEIKKTDPWVKVGNIKSEIVTTAIGAILMGACLYDALSSWDMPSIDGVERKYQLVVLFILGFGHLFLKDTLIEVIKDILVGFKDLVKGFFTKKKE